LRYDERIFQSIQLARWKGWVYSIRTARKIIEVGDQSMSNTAEAITSLLAKYNDALNASSTDAVMPLYADDGVFMPPYTASAVGPEAVRKAYDAVFNAITLNVKFTIAEIVEMTPGWAFARTNSAGTTTIHETGAKNAEGNQELFIFKKEADGDWKIARYSFSPTNPPRR
jgi:uncharacterized protein (TIGR02246 family)